MAQRTAAKSRARDADKDTPVTNPIEWGIAAVAAVLLLALLAFLVYEVITRGGSLPAFELSVEEIAEGPTSYAVVVEVFNAGHTTAAAVEIEGTLTAGDETIVSHVAIDYVPAESGRQVALLFDRDPREGELNLRIIGYTEP